MPFTHNADRRHKFAKADYKVTNWSDYKESLRQRSDITNWLDESVAHFWFAQTPKRRGRPAMFFDFAIKTCLRAQSAFSLALRQSEEFVRSVIALIGLDLPVRDFSTLSRRSGGLVFSKPKPECVSAPSTVVIDSTA
ncbi:hypothetical protein PsAD2_02956 [Pseudovibrio axinellae]|uniref:Transposase DDE domain-containing protein n=1 Tax=Pseudovibrio axinellae TaxID=989403 RepID=A0A165XE52_9HYPH|nr:transposase [Pseudovibrio axinellae]KZL17620.1 hypothetical protein PsAD2_02956 [Pseudovibrio axinellae]SER46013.1 Transposase DDE domain-containing protein [Pseudovibrio axinellae]